MYVSAREKKSCRKHSGKSSLCRKDLQTKHCSGNGATGVMKHFLTKKCFILHLHPSAELPLNTSSIRQGWTGASGGLAGTPCKARLPGVPTMLDCPVCPQTPHCPQGTEPSLWWDPPFSRRDLFDLTPSFHSSCDSLQAFTTSSGWMLSDQILAAWHTLS